MSKIRLIYAFLIEDDSVFAGFRMGWDSGMKELLANGICVHKKKQAEEFSNKWVIFDALKPTISDVNLFIYEEL